MKRGELPVVVDFARRPSLLLLPSCGGLRLQKRCRSRSSPGSGGHGTCRCAGGSGSGDGDGRSLPPLALADQPPAWMDRAATAGLTTSSSLLLLLPPPPPTPLSHPQKGVSVGPGSRSAFRPCPGVGSVCGWVAFVRRRPSKLYTTTPSSGPPVAGPPARPPFDRRA
jgi:hypothetical protein